MFIMRNSDGSNPVITDEHAHMIMKRASLAFRVHGIDFHYTIIHVDDDAIRARRVDAFGAMSQFMSDVSAVASVGPLPVYAVRIYIIEHFLYNIAGIASTDSDVKGGRVALNKASVALDEDLTLPHELGHLFGLDHPFANIDPNGADECDFCWAEANPGSSAIRLEESGDFCSDTPWSGEVSSQAWRGNCATSSDCPLNDDKPIEDCIEQVSCPGRDVVHTAADVATTAANYMSYYECNHKQSFTPLQGRRMRCFLSSYWKAALYDGTTDPAPAGWTCPKEYYSDETCDCDCGVCDPACDDAAAVFCDGVHSVKNRVCVKNTLTCKDVIPASWSCLPEYYTDDLCHCECGARDPKCGEHWEGSPICGGGEPVEGKQCNKWTFLCEDIPENNYIPVSWKCPSALWLDDNCDCNCGAWDPKCGVEGSPVFCNGGLYPFEGKQCNEETLQCEGEAIVPESWTCPPALYSDDTCDCGCGAGDPMCGVVGVVGMSCGGGDAIEGMKCNKETFQCEPVPTSWTCDVTFWNDGDCDCGCGAWDKTCDVEGAPVLCEGEGATCNKETFLCEAPLPTSWICDEEFYRDGDCDCGCGAWDPKCDVEGVDMFCGGGDAVEGKQCNKETFLCEDKQAPTSWTCGDEFYWDGDCDCECGAWDPKCDHDLEEVSIFCSGGDPVEGKQCNKETFLCEDKILPVPTAWACGEDYYRDNDCDCNCGAWDPSCDVKGSALFCGTGEAVENKYCDEGTLTCADCVAPPKPTKLKAHHDSNKNLHISFKTSSSELRHNVYIKYKKSEEGWVKMEKNSKETTFKYKRGKLENKLLVTFANGAWKRAEFKIKIEAVDKSHKIQCGKMKSEVKKGNSVYEE
eukprot:TRINITY_DN226_c0_g1_i2.p1 TRINITY_DN226_c0_g1~~TRINITY_DN226_c0_g1_i2.p1  ORF type:complete len:858 (+),score=113.82 TRINITY_DN226_c0_g1_i2:383-2956(+)